VEKSGDDFPYIREHIRVEVPEPAEATRIKLRISEKERQKTAVLAELDTVESYIAGLPEGLEKTILESIYLDDMTQEEVARMTGYSRSRIAQIVGSLIKD
jgi:DNA-directed RNA polymerase specialized sigma subunit